MSAHIICSPSWGMTDIIENAGSTRLGATLANLICRDGVDAVSDMLNEHELWLFLDFNLCCGESPASAMPFF